MLKGFPKLPVIRAHLYTLAISVSCNATWRLPRDAFRYGGLTYGLVLTAALVFIALPMTLLQLAIGQLSQQDAIGVWKAVPFFKGIGYLKMLISFLSSTYTQIYVSLTIVYFFYSASNSIPFPNCMGIAYAVEEGVDLPVSIEIPLNASECISVTFMSAIGESPEYYLATAFVIVVLWITTPFIFFEPVKWMKRLFYVLGPVTVLLGIVTVSFIGDGNDLSTFVFKTDWKHCLDSKIWHAALVQALWSCQIAGGYLISAGDSVYSAMNVKWTSLAVVGANIISSWFWLLFWFSLSGSHDKDTSVLAVLLQTYQAAMEKNINITWHLVLFAILITSGIIGMLAMVHPLWDYVRRIGGVKWRLVAICSSLAGATVSLALLGGRMPAITLVDNIAVPVLICIATALEILALGFIYGWQRLIEDVVFLTESDHLPKYWVWGWWLSPTLILPLFSWWVTDIFRRHSDWSDPSLEAVTVIGAISVALIVIAISASITVARQVQYDCGSKFKSSFQPSRHWGPRDPITHYYWLARRDEAARGQSRTRYRRRKLGELSRPSFLTVSESIQTKNNGLTPNVKKRSNSDDWVYTLGRKEVLAQLYKYADERKRSKSLDWELIIKMKSSDIIRLSNDNSIVSRY